MDIYSKYVEQQDEYNVLDRWFQSDQWRDVLESAQTGCVDSLELIQEVNDHLTSIIFHMKNSTYKQRIMYELKYFETLCDDFEVA